MGYAQFNRSGRYNRTLQFLLGKHNNNFDQDISDYCVAAEDDLSEMVTYAIPYFFPIAFNDVDDFKFVIDRTDFKLSASVRKRATFHEIKISIGAIMAIDDCASVLTRELFPQGKVLFDISDKLKMDTRFRNYSFLLDASLQTGSHHRFITLCPVAFEELETLEFRAILSNFSVLWMVLHEIGHVQLDHFAMLRDGQRAVGFVDDIELAMVGPEAARGQSASSVRMAMEFSADLYASLKMFTTFFRRDAIGNILPKTMDTETSAMFFIILSASIPSLLLHRMQTSAAADGFQPRGDYPLPSTRLFNTLVSLIPGVDNNAHHLKAILGAFEGMTNVDAVKRKQLEETIIRPQAGQVLAAYSAIIPLLDNFLRRLQSIPLLPWTLVLDLEHRSIHYRSPGVEKLQSEHANIIAALMASPFGIAKWDIDSRICAGHREWKATIRSCYAIWEKEIEAAADMKLSFGAHFDYHIREVYMFIREVVRSGDEYTDMGTKYYDEIRSAAITFLSR